MSKYKSLYQQLIGGLIISLLLSACHNKDTPEELEGMVMNTPIELNGVVINSSNYQAVFQKSVIASDRLLESLSRSMLHTLKYDLSSLQVASQTSSNTTYDCNATSSVQIATIEDNTERWVFSDCFHAAGNFTYYGQTYNGKITVVTTIVSGNRAEIYSQDSINYNWTIKRAISFENFEVSGENITGNNFLHNGDLVITVSNDAITNLRRRVITSTNLVSVETESSGSQIEYAFSSLSNDFLGPLSNATGIPWELDFDFLANITNIGDIQFVVDTPLKIVDGYYLIDGNGTIDTGTSTAKFTGIGTGHSCTGISFCQDIELSLDPESDGVFEEPLTTSWVSLGGGGGFMDWMFFGSIIILISLVRGTRRKIPN